MKVFRTENGQNKVYIQMNDIAVLTNSTIAIPASIFTKVFSDIVIIDDRNRFDFIEFSEEAEIQFFKKLEWIIDYDEFMNFSAEELNLKVNQIIDEVDKIVDTYNNMTNEQKKLNENLIEEYELRKYMLACCKEIYAIKNGISKMTLPEFISGETIKTKEKKISWLDKLKKKKLK